MGVLIDIDRLYPKMSIQITHVLIGTRNFGPNFKEQCMY